MPMSHFMKALLVLGPLLVPAAAQADPTTIREVLKRSCTADYLEYCGDHAPGGPEVEACFRDNMKKLSPACASAITAFKREQKVKRISENN